LTSIDGVKVTVDGAPLDPRVDVMEFTKNGFEWSYEGPEPRQLALRCWSIISATTLPRSPRSRPSCAPSLRISKTSGKMTSDDIDLALTALDGKAVA
jgi:hypothetical protein